MGEVWKARDTRLDRIVAIKTSSEKFSERFEPEARAIARLNHPNICMDPPDGLDPGATDSRNRSTFGHGAWSPDGRSIVIPTASALLRMDLDGGSRQPLGTVLSNGLMPAWGPKGIILFSGP